MPREKVLELEVSLIGIEPPIRRRLTISNAGTLGDLSAFVQVTLGWEGVQRHQFRFGKGQRAGSAEHGLRRGWIDEDEIPLREALPRRGSRLTYRYDKWQVAVQRVTTHLKGQIEHPCCLAAERAAPPEDSEGPRDYAKLLSALARGAPMPKGWEGWEDFEPERVNLELINEALLDFVPPGPGVPDELRERCAQIRDHTDAFCEEHLGADFAELCADMIVELANLEDSPLACGKPLAWAAAILRVLTDLNGVSAPGASPYLDLDEIGHELGVSKRALLPKSEQIQAALAIDPNNTEWVLEGPVFH